MHDTNVLIVDNTGFRLRHGEVSPTQSACVVFWLLNEAVERIRRFDAHIMNDPPPRPRDIVEYVRALCRPWLTFASCYDHDRLGTALETAMDDLHVPPAQTALVRYNVKRYVMANMGGCVPPAWLSRLERRSARLEALRHEFIRNELRMFYWVYNDEVTLRFRPFSENPSRATVTPATVHSLTKYELYRVRIHFEDSAEHYPLYFIYHYARFFRYKTMRLRGAFGFTALFLAALDNVEHERR